jgi:leucyl-tRNA synthetase
LAPYAPHFGEELWSILGETASVQSAGWPTFNPAILESDTQTLVVQVNGKKRAEIELPKDADESVAMEIARQNANVQAHLIEKEIKRVIYVKNRILNIVVA